MRSVAPWRSPFALTDVRPHIKWSHQGESPWSDGSDQGLCCWWRWRESNPRPSSMFQGFSGRSLFDVLLGPGAHTGKSPTGPATVRVPARPCGRSERVSPLDEIRTRAEGTPGLTLRQLASGGESEVSALGIGTYWFPGIVNETTLGPRPASPEAIVRSRNRSPPC
jgi:hypothetical protein